MSLFRFLPVAALIATVFASSFPFETAASQSQSPDRPAPLSTLPNGAGRDLTIQICGQCHAVGMFSNQRHDRDEWNSVIGRMIDKGMNADEADLYDISDYLTEYLGKSGQNDSNES